MSTDNTQTAAKTQPAATPLDARGLPAGYNFKPDWEITPREVKSMLDNSDKFIFIDCRNPNEYEITRIDGTRLIPLPQLALHIADLRQHTSEKIVVHCKSGGRSLQFTQLLRQNGFMDVRSMAGGILLWNRDISPGGPQY
jgi:sulfur-carrier protein adenylyltransferase/sulfurtransferase